MARGERVSALEQLRVDLRGAVRGFRRAPGLAIGGVALLALGIAGVTTLFAPLHAFVLRPLPFPDPDRLVVVGTPVLDGYTHSFPDRRALDPVFSGIAAYRTMEGALSQVAPPVVIAVAAVTQEFFATLGKPPWRGTDFAALPINQACAVVSS